MTEPARTLLPMLNADEVSEGVQRILHAATTKGNYQDGYGNTLFVIFQLSVSPLFSVPNYATRSK